MTKRRAPKPIRNAVLGACVALAAAASPSLAEGVERGVVERGPVRIEVLAQGSGPAVVLLPSLARGAEDFDQLAALIAAAGFRVIRPEPRGIGGSAGPVEGLTLYDLAADAALAIEADAGGRVAPVIVAGHAFGNWVARALSAIRPELVRGVVLLAASIGTEIDPGIRASINGSFDPALPEAERLRHLQRGYFAPGNDARVWLTGWHPAVARMQRAATAATPDRSWQRVADRVPVLYVAAVEDTIAPLPTLARLQQELGPRVTLAEVARAGHALLPEQPEATAAALIRFARELP
ncbi:alpha/beta fold hydrolase [Plastoroseomonas hellenica]|uniref:alpha/beta fold hydrolase n=1 Tax=Plastoroseomonas hellenica TaxID=2687306 RepID=UPI001BA9CF6E|nr:alpha/beta hydrolase [Plastoroseomonas hellenica]MBR0641519.1 alpha/beta hydrolase [Plastoroseomonas hellenica]